MIALPSRLILLAWIPAWADPVAIVPQETVAGPAEQYLTWTAKQAEEIGKAMRVNGRVGGWFDARVTHTEHSYNYKLRATWLTPEVIRAAARLRQMQEGLSTDEARALVHEAEAAGDTVIMVEIDPREGSGVIPREWVALLRPKALEEALTSVRGVERPNLRLVKALSGTSLRDYAYDVFWIVFPLLSEGGELLFPETVHEAELVVRILNKEGRVTWPIPESVRQRARAIAAAR